MRVAVKAEKETPDIDREGVSFIEADVADAGGTIVSDAHPRIRFKVRGQGSDAWANGRQAGGYTRIALDVADSLGFGMPAFKHGELPAKSQVQVNLRCTEAVSPAARW